MSLDEHCFDRQGNSITWQRAMELSADEDYRHLADNHIGHPGRLCGYPGVYRVSSVWLGFALPPFPLTTGPPLVFETMVFDHINDEIMWQERWPPQEVGVLRAHRLLVRWCRNKWRRTNNKHLIEPVPWDERQGVFDYYRRVER